MSSINIPIYSCSSLSARTSSASLRLVGGQSPNEGRVEIYHDGEWGTVCNDNWDIKDATVACRSIGLPPATYALYNRAFGIGTGRVWLTNLHCSGSESSLGKCSRVTWGSVGWNCYYKDAGVVCGTPKVYQYNVTNMSGVITSPGYPQYMLRGHFEWTFKPPFVKSIFLYFEECDLVDNYHNIWKGNVTVEDAFGKELVRVEGQRRNPFSVLITTNEGKLVFHSPFTYSRRRQGFRLRYCAVNGSLYRPSVVSTWKISAIDIHVYQIQVSWRPLSVEKLRNRVASCYIITCKSTDSWGGVSYTAITTSTTAILRDLIGYTNYRVQVIASVTGSKGMDTLYGTRELLVRTKEGVPIRRPSNMTLRIVGARDVLVQWDHFPRKYVHGTLLGYKVYYQDYETRTRHLVIVPPNSTQVVLRDIPPARHIRMKYTIYVQGFTASGEGLSSSRRIRVYTKCEENITTNKIITSPGYHRPSRGGYSLCVWTLIAPNKNQLIVVLMEDVDLPLSARCRVFYVAFLYGPGQKFSKFCGRRSSITLVSTGTAKLVFYARSRSVEWRGFKARFYVDFPIEPKWKINAYSSHSRMITVQWPSYPVMKGSFKVLKYMAVCTAVKESFNTTFMTANNTVRQLEVTNLMKYTEYSVQVLAVLGGLLSSSAVSNWTEKIRGSEKVIVRTGPPPIRRLPSTRDLWNSVNITIKDLTISQWHRPMESKFKKAVAAVVTSFCARGNKCISSSRRKRRANDFITFTEDQVHLLPGFPIQLHTAGDILAVVALYVQFPPGVTQGRVKTINKLIVIKIVRESISNISKAINKTILSVSEYMLDHLSTTTAIPTVPPKSNTLYVIIGVSVAGVILIVVVAVLIRRKMMRDYVELKEGARRTEIEMQQRNVTSDEELHDSSSVHLMA